MEVVAQSGDGGVDVIAEIEFGVTLVRGVVQAKRFKGTVQRKDLDALRGLLYRFGALRGTIVTTSRYTTPGNNGSVVCPRCSTDHSH